MSSLLSDLFADTIFVAHGYCLSWDSDLIALHVGSDLLIALAYYTIPIGLLFFTVRRRDLDVNGLLFLFAGFILLCGTTHLIAAVTIWEPIYVLDGWMKLSTALVSVATSITLWMQLPTLLRIPSPADLHRANAELVREVADRRAAEQRIKKMNAELEARVAKRTEDLELANGKLREEVTKRALAQGRLEDAMKSLEEASRAKSDFLAGVTHELRPPLNVIMGYAETIAEDHLGLNPHDRIKDYANDIHRSGRYLLGIVNDLLDFSRMEAGQLELHEEDFRLREALDDALALIRPQADAAGIIQEVTHPPTDLKLRGDRRLVTQTLVNVLVNAVKFTDRGGTISIGFTRPDTGELVIEIADTGIGIRQEDISRVLEPFVRIEREGRARQGTGLGLPLCKRFMEAHGGKLDIESVVGDGTEVRLVFPARRVI